MSPIRNFPSFFFAVLVLYPVFTSEAETSKPDGLDSSIRPFFAEYCTQCHGEKKQKGDFRVDELLVDFESPGIMGHWEEIMSRINSGDMPPEDEPFPEPDQISDVSDWIVKQLLEAEAVQQSAGHRVDFLKLSRIEYANTIRDLLGVNFDASGPTGLPEDPDWHGFERIGAEMSVSPFHVEKYLAAADAILDEALSLRPEPERELVHWDGFFFRAKSYKDEYTARGIADQVRTEIVPNNYTTDTWRLNIKEAGDYRVRVKLSGLRPEGGRAPRLKLYIPILDQTLIQQDVDAPEDRPVTIEARVHLTAGNHPIRIINSVPGPNPEARRSRHTQNHNAFTTMKSRIPWQMKLTDDDFKPIEPTLIIDSIDWDGPILESWPTPAHQKIFASQDPREIVTKFAERAWRRPVRAEEVDSLMGPYEQSQELGESFEQSVRGSLLAVLCSDSFLYLEEGDLQSPRQQLNDWELASRLSYFLWSTMPDEELLALARKGALHEPGVLRTQVKRLLADERSDEFARSFPYQWLQLRKVGMFAPDKDLYPDYDDNLEDSMKGETLAFFNEVLRSNASLREFLDSGWTMLNERLATHYGIDGIRGDTFRRVALKPEDHRGGLLTQGSILGLTSDGTRHRPVHRGVWVLESIIGKPPPPPPANVPALSTPAADTKKSTVREKLELHRSDPNCASCHSKIDPLGIAFDNYDAIGRWRTVETVRDGTGANPVLDPSGVLPDGRTFEDSAQLRKLLLDDADQFAAAFTEKLATYAMRRGMTFSDREVLQRITAEAKKNDYQLASLIESFVTSPLFLKR